MRPAELWDRLVCVLYPPRCVLCGEVIAYDDTVCKNCIFAREEFFLPARGPLQGVISPFAYGGTLRYAVRTIKEYRDRRTLQFLAEQMGEVVDAHWGRRFDAIVPVPASARTRRQRGFNQAEALAQELSRLMGAAVMAKALAKYNKTAVQHELSAKERRKNAASAYYLRDGAALGGKRVLLVDDVYTTGATLEICAMLLKNAGATVYGVTATHTPLETRQKA